MKKLIKYLIITLFVLQFTHIDTSGQIDKSNYYNRGQKFYYNYFYEPADDGDSIKVFTIYKIAYDLLKFVKDENSTIEERYVAYPKFEVDFQDEEGIIRKRDKVKDTIIVYDYKLINSIDKFYYGSVISKLSFQEYHPFVYLWDEDLVKLGEKKLPPFNLKNFKTELGISSPLVCYEKNDKETGDSLIYPYILDRNAAFSSNDILFYFITKNNDKEKEYYASIEYLDAQRSTVNWQGPTRINIHKEVFNDKIIKFISKKNERPIFQLIDGNPETHGYSSVVKFRLTADLTAPGKYKLRVWDNKNSDTLEFPFSIIWENMPLTLRTPSYAAQIMYYVLTDEEYDEIKSGSDREILRKIFKWWEKHDPTRFTIYNEAMNEYFKRADYAFFNFKTIYEKDGAKTDRGKIYILNGPPDEVNEEVKTNGEVIVIWTYNRLRKKYIFETDKTGIIYLKEIKDF